MAVEPKSKVYGLSFPTKKSKDDTVKRIESVFNTNSDDDDGGAQLKPLEVNPNSRVSAARLNRKTKSDFEKALEEDPSIFEYDEIYEDICNKKVENAATTIDKAFQKKSRYVNRLIKTANERKLERELCSERKAHKEIEAEAHLYGDKETFVTSAYKSKLNDLDELVKKRREEETRENYMDITKQEGLGGFYRYMYQHGTESVPQESPASIAADDIKQGRSPIETAKETGDSMKSASADGVRCEADKSKTTPNDRDSVDRTSQDRPSDRHSYTSSSRRPAGSSVAHVRTASSNPDIKVIPARQRVASEEELAQARQRYLARKAAGIHPRIVTSDSEQ